MDAPPIFVTRPSLPPLDEFLPYLQRIWDSRQLTNGGPYHQQFEAVLSTRLSGAPVSLCSNATSGLILALKALDLQGEVVVTPYTFVATGHALLWAGLEPVFCDIDPRTGNLDAAKIEGVLTPRTSAVLAVHCYGNPCDVNAIEAVARRNGLKVVYDAAHAFGARTHGRDLLGFGDASVVSFHATKVFNTIEGGAVVCRDHLVKERIDRLKNFGLSDEVTVSDVGLNAKMSEFNAALGLLQLEYVDAAIAARRALDLRYREALAGVSGIECLLGFDPPDGNFAYFPIVVRPDYGLPRDKLHRALADRGIHARRYFAAPLTALSPYAHLPSARPELVPQAVALAASVLCLPIYPDLTLADQDRVIDAIRTARRQQR
jgi:dTDP-4-amino-4,6-dideoxygalactose transaminase